MYISFNQLLIWILRKVDVERAKQKLGVIQYLIQYHHMTLNMAQFQYIMLEFTHF